LGRARLRRAEAVGPKTKPVTQKDVVWREMLRAYMMASADNEYPANKRQIYYAIRDEVEKASGRPLRSTYFSLRLRPLSTAHCGNDSWEKRGNAKMRAEPAGFGRDALDKPPR
jgi:hypothetical protein